MILWVLTGSRSVLAKHSSEYHNIFSGEIKNIYIYTIYMYIQYNLNGLNMDGSFTVDDSNSFFSSYKILPIAQENKYLMIFSYFIMGLHVVCTH